jgi:hypothetical protein
MSEINVYSPRNKRRFSTSGLQPYLSWFRTSIGNCVNLPCDYVSSAVHSSGNPSHLAPGSLRHDLQLHATIVANAADVITPLCRTGH